MNKLQEFFYKPQFGKILKHVPNFKHIFKNIFPLTYLPLVEFLGHIKCTQASVSGWAALASNGLLLAMQVAALVKQDSGHRAGKLLRQLKVVVSNKLWPSILPLAKLVHSTGWEHFIHRTQNGCGKQIADLLAWAQPKLMVFWTRSFKNLILTLVTVPPDLKENGISLLMKTFPLRKGLGGWFLGGWFYFNILKYFKFYFSNILKYLILFCCVLGTPLLRGDPTIIPHRLAYATMGWWWCWNISVTGEDWWDGPKRHLEELPCIWLGEAKPFLGNYFQSSNPTAHSPLNFLSPNTIFHSTTAAPHSKALLPEAVLIPSLQPELGLAQLNPALAGNFLEDSRMMSVVCAGMETRCSILDLHPACV